MGLCFQPSAAVHRELANVDLCPELLAPARDVLLRAVLRARARWFGNANLLDATHVVFLGLYSCAMAYAIFIARPATPLPQAAYSLTRVLIVMVFSAALARASPAGNASSTLAVLDAAAQTLARGRTLDALRERLAAANSEAEMLRAAGDSLLELLPGATAFALGTFALGGSLDGASLPSTKGTDAISAAP